MSVDNLLSEFGTRTGMGDLRRNGDGVCQLVFDNEYVVDIECPDGSAEMHLSCMVGPLDQETTEGFAYRLLAGNLMGRETGGAALALDDLAGEIVLCRSLPADGLRYEAFEALLARFVSAAARWRDIIDANEPLPTAGASPDGGGFDMIRI